MTAAAGEQAHAIARHDHRKVNNFFGGLLGVGTTTIKRTAVGEFARARAMGSPSNVFGNEPAPDGTWSSVTGNSSFWVNVAGATDDEDLGRPAPGGSVRLGGRRLLRQRPTSTTSA